MKNRRAESERKRPLYSFDRIKNRNVQAKSPNTTSIETSLVDSIAELIAEMTLNVEFELKYAGTALARKGETRIAPRTGGSNQNKTFFLDESNVLGEANTINAVITVVAKKTTALNECVRYMEPTKIEVETRNGVAVNLSF